MGCILTILALLTPRLVMVFVFLLTDWFAAAFETVLWPLLGFLFMPYTTLAWMAGELHGGVNGGWTLLLVAAIVVDLAHLAGSGRHYRVYRRRRA